MRHAEIIVSDIGLTSEKDQDNGKTVELWWNGIL